LQQQYEEAVRLTSEPRPDRSRVHALLAECLRTDPGNILYLDAVLANLRRWTDRPKPKAAGRLFGAIRWLWRRRKPAERDEVISSEYSELGTQSSVPTTADRSRATGVLARSPEILFDRHTVPATLRSLAAACAVCELDEAELRYLYAARDVAPDDAQTLRMLARSLTRQGRFEEATGPWFAVAALAPDAEAEQAIDDIRLHFRGEPEPIHRLLPSHLTTEAQMAVHQAWSLQASGEFDAAQDKLLEAQSASGGDLTILQEREELQLARSRHRLQIARRRAVADSHPLAQLLVGRLETEHNRLEIDVLHVRCERLPNDKQARLELARRLKRAGNYSGAIQRLEECLTRGPLAPQAGTSAISKDTEAERAVAVASESACPAALPARGASGPQAEVLVELGESWQHLRQFAKALEYYREAIAGADPASDAMKVAHYRAGVLAAAMNDQDSAQTHLAAVVAADPAFKDARERLDKLNST
jgi:tetratricopeptide (TPR) repeat protein